MADEIAADTSRVNTTAPNAIFFIMMPSFFHFHEVRGRVREMAIPEPQSI
jgi:hypothetical protein